MVQARKYYENLGFTVGYNPITKGVVLNGVDIGSKGLTMGGDDHYYGDNETALNKLIVASALSSSPQSSGSGRGSDDFDKPLDWRVHEYDPYYDKNYRQAVQEVALDEFARANARGIFDSSIPFDNSYQRARDMIDSFRKADLTRYGSFKFRKSIAHDINPLQFKAIIGTLGARTTR